MYNAWNIYAFGDASVIVNILDSISAMVSSSEYHEALLFVAMLAFIGMAVVASISGTMNGMGIKLVLMFIGFVFLIDVGFNDTVNVNVISALGYPGGASSSSGTTPGQNYGSTMAIGDIPFIVGVPESVITTFGHELTKMIQTNMSLPGYKHISDSGLGVADGGFNLANSLINAETKMQVVNPYFSETLSAFAQNCVMPSIAGGWVSPNIIATSTDLFPTDGAPGSYSAVNPALNTFVYNSEYPKGAMVPCAPAIGTKPSTQTTSASTPGNAYNYIAWYLHNKVSITGMNPGALGIQSFSKTGADSWLSTVDTAANSVLLGSGSDSSANDIMQAAAINGMNPALRAAAAMSGGSANMMDIAVAQGKQQMVSGWATAAAIFKEMTGYLYAILQALVLAMAPLVILAMFIPGTGVKLVGSYLQVAVWLALWQPLLAIVNYIVLLYSVAQSGTILQGSSGFTMENLPVVSEFTSRMILAGSFMATMVPLFAWGMVKGGMAVTDMITRGLGQSILSQAGTTAATGNVTLGNESWDDDTIDQNMLMPKYSVGYGMVNSTVDGNGITAISELGGTGLARAGQRDTMAQTIQQRKDYAIDMAKSGSFVQSAAFNAQRAAEEVGEVRKQQQIGTTNDFSSGHNTSSGRHSNLNEGARYQTSTGHTQTAGASTAKTHESGSGTKYQAGLDLGDVITLATAVGALAITKNPEAFASFLGRGGVAAATGTAAAGTAATGAGAGVTTALVAGSAGALLTRGDDVSDSLNSGNKAVRGTGTGLENKSSVSNGNESAGGLQSQAQNIYQAIHTLKGILNNNSGYSGAQRATLQNAYNHLITAQHDLREAKKYQEMASESEGLTINQPVAWGTGVGLASTGNVNLQRHLMGTGASLSNSAAPGFNPSNVNGLVHQVTAAQQRRKALMQKVLGKTVPAKAAADKAWNAASPYIGGNNLQGGSGYTGAVTRYTKTEAGNAAAYDNQQAELYREREHNTALYDTPLAPSKANAAALAKIDKQRKKSILERQLDSDNPLTNLGY
ncbi:conjugal transfer protein TraG N-terminal domain-containing protein [Acidithiobacillus sp. M4-SHS-6]|uniref:conjugal transfer protein TraG N-terminal domain-containing protein n=1 Tax=Acidithiobacillus sp. M4-SHS-6 TaxID=3383024 RepID=UPI0039BE3839